MEIRKIFEYALAREREGKRFFESNAERLSHSAAIEAFRRLAFEEQKHIEFIEAQLTTIGQKSEADITPGIEFERTQFFKQRALGESIEQTISEAMLPDLPVLRMAYLIERDFAEFYEQVGNQSDGPAQQVLLMLAQWERGHERFFKEWHDKVFEEYAKMPWGG